jgi:tetratricopeptide (TPR) repeat protein
VGQFPTSQDKYPQALEIYQQALTTFKANNDRRGEATTLSNIGVVYDSQGKYPQALDLYQRSLVIRRELGDICALPICNGLERTYQRF